MLSKSNTKNRLINTLTLSGPRGRENDKFVIFTFFVIFKPKFWDKININPIENDIPIDRELKTVYLIL
jgi:hypothetical protein